MEVFFIILLWIVAIYLANEIGKPKNRKGFWWGFWLGWIGVIAVALLPKVEK